MIDCISYHNPKEIIEEIIQKIQNHDLTFFVGSAISSHEPSNFPNTEEIKKETIQALCGKDLKKYFNLIYSDSRLQEKVKSIRHEEFLELIYRTIGKDAIKILNYLKKGQPNHNHFFLAEGLGLYFDIILTTNQDTLIEIALESIGKHFLQVTQEGDKILEHGKIIKLHGCVEKPKTIITLLRQLMKSPPKNRSNILEKEMKNKCVLFTGYSGRDEDIFRVLISIDWKRIYWNIKPNSAPNENVKKLYRKYPDKFLFFKYDLNDLFNTLISELRFKPYKVSETSHSELKQTTFNKWAEDLGNKRFNVLGRILNKIVRYKEALQCFDRTLRTISNKTKESKRILAESYRDAGNTYMDYKTFPNNYNKAYNAYRKAALCYSEMDDIRGEMSALVGMGQIYRHRGKYKEAIKLFMEVQQRLAGKKDEDCIRAKAICYLADVYRMQDKYKKALRKYRLAYNIFKRKGFIEEAVYSQIWLGEICMYKGNYDQGLWYNRKALNIAEKYQFEQYLPWAKYVKIDIDKYRGDNLESLINKIQEVDEMFKSLGNRLGRAWSNQMLSEFYRLKGNYKEAKKINKKARRFCGKEEIDYELCLMYIWLNDAEILRAEDRYAVAIKKYKQILDTQTGQLQRHHAHAILGIAETNRIKGTGNQLEYQKALKSYKKLSVRHGIVDAFIGLALFTSLRNNDPLSILIWAENECLKKPILRKERKIIRQIKNRIHKNKKIIFSWLHPLEFP